MSVYDSYESQLDPTPKPVRRSGPFGMEEMKTVADALAFCERNQLDPAEVKLAHNYATWESAETAKEVAARIERARESRHRHLVAIREMYDKYTERGLYGDDR